MKRFFDKIMYEPNTGCWLWTAATNKCNYGLFRFGNRMIGAHRFSYLLHKGEIPQNMCVLHTCDVPQCVNPDHLFLGTHDENMKDMAKKGRASTVAKTKGITHGMCKLTENQIVEIRNDSRKLREIAKDYNISTQQISRIRNNKLWKHIE